MPIYFYQIQLRCVQADKDLSQQMDTAALKQMDTAAPSNTHSMSFNDNLEQCQGCTSLSGELHHLRVYFQSEIDSLNKKVSNCPANRQNSSLPHDGVSPDLTELLKENQHLQRRLRKVE